MSQRAELKRELEGFKARGPVEITEAREKVSRIFSAAETGKDKGERRREGEGKEEGERKEEEEEGEERKGRGREET